jgi:hypothetical protein
MDIFFLILRRYLKYQKYNFLYERCAIITQMLILRLGIYLLGLKSVRMSSIIRYTEGTITSVMTVAKTIP